MNLEHQTLRPFIKKQLALLRIGSDEIQRLRSLRPLLSDSLPGIAADFYKHMRTFSEGRKHFSDEAMVERLVAKQLAHWRRLFSGLFDDDYAKAALAIGRAHYEHGVAPYIYISGYSFFQCALSRIICVRHAGQRELPELLNAVSRVISLDIDLAISVYMKEYWAARDTVRI